MRWFADLLSPPACSACSAPLPDSNRVFCAVCAGTVERCFPSADCIAFASYGGAMATAIRRFKYEDGAYLSRPLGGLLRAACRLAQLSAELVVPVPLHAHRLATRGYNQSALLAGEIASELGASVAARALERVVDTAVQADLSRAARQTNVRDAFRVRAPAVVRNRTIALVDDVMTTGATLSACVKPLLDAGARSVTRVVLARTAADVSADVALSRPIAGGGESRSGVGVWGVRAGATAR
jgi:ComF family protein